MKKAWIGKNQMKTRKMNRIRKPRQKQKLK